MKHTDFENAKNLKMERDYFEAQSREAGKLAGQISTQWADKLPAVPTLPRRNNYRATLAAAIEKAAEQAIKEIDAEFEKL